jgi:hypothetical protein
MYVGWLDVCGENGIVEWKKNNDLTYPKSVVLQGSEEGSLPGIIILKISIYFKNSPRVYYLCACLQRGGLNFFSRPCGACNLSSVTPMGADSDEMPV